MLESGTIRGMIDAGQDSCKTNAVVLTLIVLKEATQAESVIC